jgi:hypothetical protein
MASKLTATTRDDKAVAFIAKQFDRAVKINKQVDNGVIEGAAKTISDVSSGNLKDVSIGLEKGIIKASVGGFGVDYDPSNGQVMFGFEVV